MPWTSFHKHDTANWFYVTIHVIKHIEAIALSDVWNIFQEKLKKKFPICLVTEIQFAVSCLWKEVQDIRTHMQKKHLN